MRVLIADDRPEVRSALRLLIENENRNWEVIGEAVDGLDLKNAVTQKDTDLVLLDWELPCPDENNSAAGKATTTELVRGLRERSVSLMIIAISGLAEARQQAQAAGVDGFVSKCDPPEVLLSMFQRVEARL